MDASGQFPARQAVAAVGFLILTKLYAADSSVKKLRHC